MKINENKPDYKSVIADGLIFRNPIFVQTLGMCSVLAISTSVVNGLGMGLSVTFVLFFSNIVISLLRKFIPDKIRIASYIVVIAGFVTIVEMVVNAYFFDTLAQSLGVFIPLIVVNCIILARAESFASKNGVLISAVDGIANGVGYTVALLIVSAVRELFGSGTLFGIQIMPEAFSPALLIVLPTGGFLVLGSLIALYQYIAQKKGDK